MIIDTSIVDEYIKTKSVDNIKEHWVFSLIEDGKYLFNEPNKKYIKEQEEILKLLIKYIKDFKPNNIEVWQHIFGKYKISNDKKILLIIGSPNPYDAMVREDLKGNKIIIFDVEQLRAYNMTFNKMVSMIQNIITHEMAHILIDEDFSLYNKNSSNFELLKQQMFDEGFAHYISYSNLEEIDWNKPRLQQCKIEAYKRLREKLTNEITEDVLIEGNSGAYWS